MADSGPGLQDAWPYAYTPSSGICSQCVPPPEETRWPSRAASVQAAPPQPLQLKQPATCPLLQSGSDCPDPPWPAGL